jgi:hypothetical protein
LIGHFSDEQTLSMLQTTVHPFQELRQVKATAALLKTRTKKDLNYEAYSTLLLSAATDYDSKHMANKGKRLVYAHDMMDHYDEKVASFDMDTPVDTIQAFASKFSPRLGSHGIIDRVCMSKDKWPSLYQKTKGLWDQIDDKYKSLV